VVKLRLTKGARADIARIAVYVASESGSRKVAENIAAQLRERCQQLASLPATMGRPRPELHEGLRSSVFKSYVIFYRYVEDRLEVVNILEGHRDIDAYFHPEDEA
jgi:toxin ParE1/3/4